jgi:sugar lactone lactonase YvrE
MKDGQWRCLWQAETLLGEGPLWWAERETLLFVDIKRPAILSWSTNGVTASYPMPMEIGCITLRRHSGLAAMLRDGLAFVDLSPLAISLVLEIERELPDNRFNDGKCDPQGRLWSASMDDRVKDPTGAIWRISGDLSASRMEESGHIVGNGFGWSPDGATMYFTDSEARVIFAYAFDGATGALGARRVFATVPADAGYPDGLTVDEEGGVWSAHWDGGRITRYRPDGSIDRVILMPVPRPTSLAFGGDGLGRLFVTSASIGLSADALAEAPLSGALFEVDAGVRGRPEARFTG